MGATSVRELLRVDAGTPAGLGERDPGGTPGTSEAKGRRELAADQPTLFDLQDRLFAEGTRSVLLVLQGMDTSGKGGTLEHVVGAMGPQGCRITSFKAPTPEELRHHYLWRIRRALPPPGLVGVFDRSHYEEVLVVRVHDLVPEAVWSKRYDELNRFEAGVAASGTTIVKAMLHISYDEQRERLLARLDDPDKHWKFRERDIDERGRWDDYQAAYEDALTRCSTEAAPWYVVPADHKWYRNWAISRILVETLEEMDPRYPRPELDVPGLRARLRPPN
jgi:PPK2 family polyphosphate:nucleotide phosphotransferase